MSSAHSAVSSAALDIPPAGLTIGAGNGPTRQSVLMVRAITIKEVALRNTQRRWTWALALYLVMISLILWVAYQGEIPAIIARIPYYDKFGHALLLGALGYLMHRALGRRTLQVGPLALPLGFVLATGLILLEELAQFWSPYRNSSPLDFAADLVGLGLWWLVDRMAERREKGKKS